MAQFGFLDNLQGKLQDYFAPNQTMGAPNSALPPQMPPAAPEMGMPQDQGMMPMPQGAPGGDGLSSFLQQPGQMPSPEGDQDGLQAEIMRLGTIQYLKDLLKQLKGGEGGQNANSGGPSLQI